MLKLIINVNFNKVLRVIGVWLSAISYSVFACGVHQNTGLYFVTEPGSLSVFENIISERQKGHLNNAKKPDHFKRYNFTSALNKPSEYKIPFSLFEAIKGHYSTIVLGQNVQLQGRNTLPSAEELVVISELDILDALAMGTLTWQQAKTNGLVKVNGSPQDIEMLDLWFSQRF